MHKINRLKMKKFLRTLTALVVFCTMLSSCSSEKDDVQTEQSINSCFEYVTDLSNGTEAYYENLGYAIRLNYTKNTAEIAILGLKLCDGTEYPTVVLNDLPFAFDQDGWININGKDVNPNIPGVAAKPLFNSVKVRLLHRMLETDYIPVFMVKITINHRYSITSAPNTQHIWGNTTSTDAEGTAFTTDKTVYRLNFNINTRTVNVLMGAASFIGGMPAMDIEMREIPFSVSGENVTFAKPFLTPYIGDTPYERFPITDVKGELVLDKGMELEFVCTPGSMGGSRYEVEFEGSFSE